jgi:hypothetical protein
VTAGTSPRESPELWRNPFTAEMRVWPHLAGGPQYGDDPWDLALVANRVNMGERYIHFAGAPDVHRMTVKNILVTVAAPDREVVVAAGVVRRGDGTPPAGLYDYFRKLVVIAKWSEDNGIARFAEWTQADADRFLDDLRTGQHRAGGVGLGASGIRGYVTTLRLLRECQAVLPDALSFFPWAGRSAASISGEVTHTENTTPPLPWETWAPLITASWAIVDRFSCDIIAASETRATLPKEPRGPAGANAYNALLDWTEQRGLLPLHTGFGRTKHQRGEANTTLLERLLGINANVLSLDAPIE